MSLTPRTDGRYDVYATFDAIDEQAKLTEASARLDGASLCSAGPTAGLFLDCVRRDLELLAGQTLDFLVGNGGDGFADDAVRVDATIVPVVVYDLAADYSTTDNPTGPWSYGSMPRALGGLTLFDHQATAPLEPGADAVSYWNTGASSWAGYHAIFANLDSAPALVSEELTVEPGEVVLHPSNSGDYAVARFTAPVDGTYELSATFDAIDGQAKLADARVMLDDQTVCGANAMQDLSLTCDRRMTMTAGQTLDFMVGNGGDGFHDDAVAVDIVISQR